MDECSLQGKTYNQPSAQIRSEEEFATKKWRNTQNIIPHAAFFASRTQDHPYPLIIILHIF